MINKLTRLIKGSLNNNEKDIVIKTNEIIDYMNGTSGEGSYKVYSALLNQSGTGAPIATVSNNTLGDIIWTRDSQGFYLGTLPQGFLLDKVHVFIGNTSNGIVTEATRNDDDSIFIRTSEIGVLPLTAVDNSLNNLPIKIEVYN